MTSPLDDLIGATVVQVETLHDYVQLYFDGDQVLAIFNEIAAKEMLPQILRDLVGTHLVRVEQGQGDEGDG